MIEIPFTKLHGAQNDFLLTWGTDIPDRDLNEIARAICARTTGIGADGWMLVWQQDGGLRTRLFNSDGSEPEISGNGTRCAAAFGILTGTVKPPLIAVFTMAGRKRVRLIERAGNRFLLEMDMGLPKTEELRTDMRFGNRDFDATILNVGNPQCVIFVERIAGGLASDRKLFRRPRTISEPHKCLTRPCFGPARDGSGVL